MSRAMLTGNAAAAWGARLADVEYVPAYPITPQTEIVETLSRWFADNVMQGRFLTMDSEHSMVTAAGAAAAAGVRTFTATSSQGLLYAFEVLYTASGWRVPFVLVNVSRGLSSPITLEPDHNDVLAARDSGFLQIHAETCQEVLDSILMAYRMAEDPRVLLPAIVNLDGFYLSFTREPVEIPEAEAVREFLPSYEPKHAFFSASKPMAQGIAVLGGHIYSFFKYQMHLAAQNALSVHQVVAREFALRFGRQYDLVESYLLEDAEYALIMSNAFATKGKAAVRAFREQGEKVGLLRLRVVRPWPSEAIVQALRGLKGVAVIDQNLSVGLGGIFYQEIAASLYHEKQRPVICSYIAGLGGKDISPAEFNEILRETRAAAARGQAPPPQLLYTDREQAQMKELLKVAGKEE